MAEEIDNSSEQHNAHPGFKGFWSSKSLFQGPVLYLLSKWRCFSIWHVNDGKGKRAEKGTVEKNVLKWHLDRLPHWFRWGSSEKSGEGNAHRPLWDWKTKILHLCRGGGCCLYYFVRTCCLSLFCCGDPDWPIPACTGVNESLYL